MCWCTLKQLMNKSTHDKCQARPTHHRSRCRRRTSILTRCTGPTDILSSQADIQIQAEAEAPHFL
jgi:hypothetical protein